MIDFEKIGKYKITGKLGQGSFGVVYKGRDAYLKRDVAIKVCSVEDEGLRQRFLREAEISGRLVHKNIVTVHEFGFEGEVPYLVQEMLSGEDLNRLVKRQEPIASSIKLDYLLQVANGLGYAHSEGVIHRDIKPGNIRVLEDARIKIMDFGIAKLASAETQLTQKGVTMGTASYLPPEQVRGAELDHRADIFSFGVLAYEFLTYERPFKGNTLSALIYQILYKVPAPMVDVWPECPESLSNLIAKCLEKKPERRHGSFAALIPELSAFRDEVVAGKWPALQGVAPTAAGAQAPQEPSDVMSQAAIAKTARGVLEGKVGDYTISTAASPEDVLRPKAGAGHSTRPIEATPAESATAAAPAEPPADAAMKTRILAVPSAEDLPVPASPPSTVPPAVPTASAEDGSEELTLRAREIIDLVAEGKLPADAAKEQLEATFSKKDIAPTASAGGTAAIPTVGAPTEGTRVGSAESTAAAPAGPSPASPAPPPLTKAPSTPPAAPPAKVAEVPVSRAQAAPSTASPEATASDTYRTVFRPPFGWLKWAGGAVAAVVLATLGWMLFRGSPEAPPEPVEAPPPPAPVVQPVVIEPTLSAVSIHAPPWAQLTEITDVQGYVQELPSQVSTPLYLELPPGQYKIHLQAPEGTEVQTCDVDVTLGTVATCTPALSEPSVTATDYFKETGWWD